MRKKVKTYKVSVASNSSKNYSEKGYDTLQLSESASNYNDTVFMRTTEYEAIFGKKKSKSSVRKKRLSVVKIVSDSGDVVYRRYYGSSALPKENIGLSPNSIMMLSDSGLTPFKKGQPSQVVSVSKGNYFMYYWTHSFHATRISFKFGMLSVILGIISIILSIALSLK